MCSHYAHTEAAFSELIFLFTAAGSFSAETVGPSMVCMNNLCRQIVFRMPSDCSTDLRQFVKLSAAGRRPVIGVGIKYVQNFQFCNRLLCDLTFIDVPTIATDLAFLVHLHRLTSQALRMWATLHLAIKQMLFAGSKRTSMVLVVTQTT